MNLVILINSAVCLVSGISLWMIWRQDRNQRFLKSFALATLCNVFVVLGYLAWLNPHPAIHLAGLASAAIASALNLAYFTTGIFQLQRWKYTTKQRNILTITGLMAYGAALEVSSLPMAGLITSIFYVTGGLVFTRSVWNQGWSQRSIGILMVLLGLNALNLVFGGTEGPTMQAGIGILLRTALTLAFANAALMRSREVAEQLHQRFETLTDHAFQGIVVACNGVVTYANPAARNMFGNTSLPGVTTRAAMLGLAELLDGRRQVQNELRTSARADGSALHLLVSNWPTEWDGQPAVQLSLVDQTEKYKAARQLDLLHDEMEKQRAEFAESAKNALLRANADLEIKVQERTRELREASQAKSQFLANMSHEIRTPMNAVLGLLRLLQGTTLGAVQSDYVRKAERAATSLLGLLNDILDFSKVEAGKLELDVQEFDLERVMRDLSVILSGNEMKKPVEFLFDVDGNVPPTLLGDAPRLLQVLINLTGNAGKFTSQGEIVTRVALLSKDQEKATLRFSVTDTGIGIAPENLTRIFDVFAQAESSTTRKFGGTGLGLSICKRLLDLMHSNIQVQSTLGKGSTFFFDLTLPIPASHPAEELPASGEICALVIDDNPVALQIIAAMARSQGWSVDCASSGTQAIALVERRIIDGQAPYDVLVVDWEMDELDGWRTLERIKRICPMEQLPVSVMLSAHRRERLAERTLQEQSLLQAYLVKPVTAGMLGQAVRSAMDGQVALRTGVRPPPVKSRRLDGVRLLLVEDNPLNQLVAKELLRKEGAEVDLADNGLLGVAALSNCEEPYDAVLMDMQMPVMDGCTATRAIRNDLGMKEVPIIAMTANTMDSDRTACLDAGMNDHVGKPFDISYLVEVLLRRISRDGQENAARRALADAQAEPSPDEAVAIAIHNMGGDRDLYREILRHYLSDVSRVPRQLEGLLLSGDQVAAQRLLHTLKGTSASVGAIAMMVAAATAERQIKTSTQQLAVAPLVDTIAQAASATCAVMEPHLE